MTAPPTRETTPTTKGRGERPPYPISEPQSNGLEVVFLYGFTFFALVAFWLGVAFHDGLAFGINMASSLLAGLFGYVCIEEERKRNAPDGGAKK